MFGAVIGQRGKGGSRASPGRQPAVRLPSFLWQGSFSPGPEAMSHMLYRAVSAKGFKKNDQIFTVFKKLGGSDSSVPSRAMDGTPRGPATCTAATGLGASFPDTAVAQVDLEAWMLTDRARQKHNRCGDPEVMLAGLTRTEEAGGVRAWAGE